MRREGWEARLAAVLEQARARPYRLGEHDCFRVACAAVEALTGRDLWTPFAGTYRTRKQALRRIAEYGGEFDAAASKLFGAPVSRAAFAQRGDIVKYVAAGEPHLGVCNGAEVALLTDAGLAFLPLSECMCCWRID